MVRSAKTMAALLASSAVVAGLGASGCDTTQNAAARVRVNSERTIEGREPVKVHGQAENIEVAEPTLVKSDGGAAVIVEIKNTGTDPVSDLPIIVGVEEEGTRAPIAGRCVWK